MVLTVELTEMFERWAMFMRTIERPEAEITTETWVREVDPIKRLYCLDCGDPVGGYTVHAHIWAQTGLGYGDGVLCLQSVMAMVLPMIGSAVKAVSHSAIWKNHVIAE
jgi:hypothetical protein